MVTESWALGAGYWLLDAKSHPVEIFPKSAYVACAIVLTWLQKWGLLSYRILTGRWAVVDGRCQIRVEPSVLPTQVIYAEF